MTNKKKIGSFYTPEYISEFIMNYVSLHFSDVERLHVFEPSVGDGSFIKAFNKANLSTSIQKVSFTGIDKIKPELEKARKASLLNAKTNTKYSFSRVDFLNYQKGLKKKFQLVVGNPPYIKKGYLSKHQIKHCRAIHDSAHLSENSVKNIWSAFLIRCSQMLDTNGVLAFVLPAELLQVKFSEELRTFLIQYFQRTEIFTFDDLLFNCKGQDTVLLIGFRSHCNPGQFYTHITNPEDLRNNRFHLTKNLALTITDTKWSHHSLDSDDIIFMNNLADRLKNIHHYCDSKPGIVTAANSFFIINEETERKYNLEDYTQPIIQKAVYVNGSVIFTEKDWRVLAESGKPVKVLCFEDSDSGNLPPRAEEYLRIGKGLGLPLGYKCEKRDNWFVIPNIAAVPQGFFFRRTHYYPKLLKNNAEVLVTDSAYKIQMRNGYDINHLVYSFYNSLTLAFAELNGRYYGGGVLELTPSEFKALPVPNVDITAKGFNTFTRKFENKNNILDILNANDFHILNTSLRLSLDEVHRVRSISQQLINKRFRKQT